jgi:phosphoribosylamine--glycine ligase
VDRDVVIFHGASKIHGNKTVTDGGRVLAVTAKGKTLEQAREKIYNTIAEIHFDNMEFRTDIARLVSY